MWFLQRSLPKLIMVVSVDLELVIAGDESLFRDFGRVLLNLVIKDIILTVEDRILNVKKR